MWLKILLCIAIVAFGTLVGFLATGKYRARKKFFAQFCSFNERYLNELAFERKPLGVFLGSNEYTGDFGKVVEGFGRSRAIRAEWSYLSPEEKALLTDYFTMLGRGDALSQRAYFGSRSSQLAEKKGSTEQEAKKQTDLSVKLGLLGGLAAVILIV